MDASAAAAAARQLSRVRWVGAVAVCVLSGVSLAASLRISI